MKIVVTGQDRADYLATLIPDAPVKAVARACYEFDCPTLTQQQALDLIYQVWRQYPPTIENQWRPDQVAALRPSDENKALVLGELAERRTALQSLWGGETADG